MVFMHDAAVEWEFFNRWIGQNEPYSLPPAIPELNQLDLFLLGHLKSNIYETPVEGETDLR